MSPFSQDKVNAFYRTLLTRDLTLQSPDSPELTVFRIVLVLILSENIEITNDKKCLVWRTSKSDATSVR